MPASVELREVTVGTILRGVSFAIAPGEAVALIGRSGAGKTTALKTINGLVQPSGGEVLIDGVPLASADLIRLRRRTGYIIQSGGLFPHRTVYENVATVPRLHGRGPETIRAAAGEILQQLGIPLDRFGARYPSSLSGGERQRVGIARAVINRPDLLLCDEPFGALDPIVRRELQELFITMRSGMTIVFVTHDLAEAMRICDRIILLDAGRVVSDTAVGAFRSLPLPLAREFVAAAGL